MIERLNDLLSDSGLFVRAGFHPVPADKVPAMPDGNRAATVILIGNAGGAMWDRFSPERDQSARHPLDGWLRPRIEEAASAVGAHPLFPNGGPPFVPIQDWAARAEPVHRSPIGIMIHPDFGLWHVYRAAFMFPEHIDLPPREDRPSPCETCAKKPCLSVCPADAFLPDRFDSAACALHVRSEEGRNCRERGCLARRACPVGRDYLYGPDQQEFHTVAMLAAVERGFGAGE